MIKKSRKNLKKDILDLIAREQIGNEGWCFTFGTAKSILEYVCGSGQRNSGRPTVAHLYAVAGCDEQGNIVRTDISASHRIVRLFHDLFEDTSLEVDDAREWGANDESCSMLTHLTRKKDELYLDYIVRLSAHPECIDIKLDDIQDNMNHSEDKKTISVEQFEKINRKIIANNYLKAVKSETIEPKSSILIFVQNDPDFQNNAENLRIVRKWSTAPIQYMTHTKNSSKPISLYNLC